MNEDLEVDTFNWYDEWDDLLPCGCCACCGCMCDDSWIYERVDEDEEGA